MKRIIWIAIGILLIFGAYRGLRAPGFKTSVISTGPAVRAVYATGSVEPTIMIPIAPRLMARIVELNRDEGANVANGEQLARLEDQDVKNAFEEIKVRRENAARELERARTLIEKGAISKSELDKFKSDFDAANAAMKRADAEAGYMILKAPQAGRIIRRDGELGQLIPANQPIFWMSGSEPLRITAEVDEEDISNVHVGNRVIIRADAFPDQIFEGVVNSVTEKGDPVARSFRVRIGLAADSPLRIGMTAETNIVLEEKKEVLLIATSAVTDRGTVWTVEDGRAVEKTIKVGIKGVEKSEVLSGLKIGEEVIVSPTAALKQGMRIRSIAEI